MVMTIFQALGFLWFWEFLLGYTQSKEFRDLQESLTWKKFFMAVFEIIGQFFFQNDVFKTPKSLFRAWDQSIHWERTWKLPDISYFTDLRQTSTDKKIPKTGLKIRFKIKETTCTLIS
jgi:hypothetical protein